MKIQHLAIIFVIIILPISIIITSYIQTQIDTISLQTKYNAKLQTATYDAIKSFQLNTINNKYSSISDSKIRDIEASISSFYNSLGVEMGSSGYDTESLKAFIPAILYTTYDGYYIYGKYYNDEIDDYQYGLKPYIYYSCRYKQGNNDFVVNYTLDNKITVYGVVNGNYITKSGFLVNPNLITNIKRDQNGDLISLEYDGVLIEREILTEQLITLDENNNAIRNEYEYVTFKNKKVYKDSVGYFWNSNNKKQYITDKETLRLITKATVNGHLYSSSALKYYANAYEFSTWVNKNLNDIEQTHAVDSNGNQIKDFAVNTQGEKIFNLTDKNNPLVSGSVFNENRISVIRKSIESNLSAAIANFNSNANEYEFAMPKFTEEDWDRLVNDVAVATFMQGIPIGSKYFNNYCIITNDKNKEVVTNDSIYIISDDSELHLATCKKLIDNNKPVMIGYKNIDFERQTVVKTEGNEVYFYPHANERDYDCMVSIAQTYNTDELIEGSITVFNANEENYQKIDVKNTSLRKAYLTALAREKYDLDDEIELDDKTNAYGTQPVITSVNPAGISATIAAVGETSPIVGFAVTDYEIIPSNFTPCDPKEKIKITVSNLIPNKIYYAWVKDAAGNISESKQFKTKAITQSDIMFIISPQDKWTNRDVIVMASTIEQGLQLQTSKDGNTWNNTTTQTFTENGTMYARIINIPETVIASIEITKIDKTKPIVQEVITRTNSATIIATDDASGIVGYAITENQTEPTNFIEHENTKSLNITIDNLVQNKTYYAWVKDEAGNVSLGKAFTTKKVITATGNITFTLNPNTWTNGNVVATASTEVTGFILQTSKDGITWKSISDQTFTANGTIYARLIDDIGQYNGIASTKITIIDKEKPTVSSVKTTTNSAEITAIDTGGSGVDGYAVTTTTTEPTNGFQTSKTFNNLKQNTTYYAWVKDKAGNVSASKLFKTGTVSTTVGNITFTLNPNTWTNGDVVVTAHTNVTDFTLQTSKDGINWDTTATQTFTVNGTIYARLVDSTNQYNGLASMQITIIDKTAPSSTTISYVGGANTCSWKNNYNINLSATDVGSGISHYEIDSNGDGNADNATGSNFVPWNGYNSCNTRFRAVDKVGNKGPWTDVQHIHMDTELPKHTNWWWGEITKDVARLYIQTTDNVGISRVQCPTSTQAGNYSNWYWFNAVWDSGANAYRCDITPSTFGHYGQIYKTQLFIYDHAGNGGYYGEIACNIPAQNIHPVGTAWDFGYTGGVQAFTVEDTGTYKLEVWGAQGGFDVSDNINYYGGNGGYSSGNISLSKGTTLYIAVGGAGVNCNYSLKFEDSGGASSTQADKNIFFSNVQQFKNSGQGAGWNGGGSMEENHYWYDDDDVTWNEDVEVWEYEGGGGGGATHIATTNRGELKNYTYNTSEVLIVAGGGGGGYTSPGYYNHGEYHSADSYGATGGGTTGGQSTYYEHCHECNASTSDTYKYYATQSYGYSFGQGQYRCGGGLYGGVLGGNRYSGGGGSGYIGGVTNGYTSNGQRSGNGYARITFVGN